MLQTALALIQHKLAVFPCRPRTKWPATPHGCKDASLDPNVVRNWCCVKKTRKRHAVREMKVDPSKSPCRGRLQTTISCFGQKPRW